MQNYFVIRNGAYTRGEIRGINAHNERLKDEYRKLVRVSISVTMRT